MADRNIGLLMEELSMYHFTKDELIYIPEDLKAENDRLITRGAILESLIENAEELTDEEIKILEKQQRQKNLKKHLE